MNAPADLDYLQLPRAASPAGWLVLWLVIAGLLVLGVALWFVGDPPLAQLLPVVRELLGR